MNKFISLFVILSSFSSVSAFAGNDYFFIEMGGKADVTTLTPCPFLNSLIRGGDIGAEETTVEALVDAAAKYGIDRNLMTLLAKARAEQGSSRIILSKLLDPSLFPAHLGSLARADGKLGTVDHERLHLLSTDSRFSTAGHISYQQLQDYQISCWRMSPMTIRDRIAANAEVELLWGLFGAYRTKDASDTETIPLMLVHQFLENNSLPDDFRINTESPMTIGRIALSLIYNICRR